MTDSTSPEEHVSKAMSKILRWGKPPVPARHDGFSKLSDVHGAMYHGSSYTPDLLAKVAKNSWNRNGPRFELRTLDGVLHIRALSTIQGHHSDDASCQPSDQEWTTAGKAGKGQHSEDATWQPSGQEWTTAGKGHHSEDASWQPSDQDWKGQHSEGAFWQPSDEEWATAVQSQSSSDDSGGRAAIMEELCARLQEQDLDLKDLQEQNLEELREILKELGFTAIERVKIVKAMQAMPWLP